MKISPELSMPTFYPAHTLNNIRLWTFLLSKEIGLTWDVSLLRHQSADTEAHACGLDQTRLELS